MNDEIKTDKCQYCGETIYLIQFGNHYKWVTNIKKKTWKCPDPTFVVRGHNPKIRKPATPHMRNEPTPAISPTAP